MTMAKKKHEPEHDENAEAEAILRAMRERFDQLEKEAKGIDRAVRETEDRIERGFRRTKRRFRI